MALTTARISRARWRPPGLGGGIKSLIRAHSASVRSVGYGVAVIPPVYRTGATYGRLFKQPLKEAGYDEQHPIEFELLTNTDAPIFADSATLLKSQMAKIGIKMNIVILDKPAMIDRFFKYDYDMIIEDF